MVGFIFFIIIMVIVFSSVNKEAKKNQSNINSFLNNAIRNENMKPRTPNSVDNEASYQINRQPNSYYNKEKIEKYKRQDMDHSEHLVENESIDSKTIGYNRCPKCGTLNSKKLDTCFMCDAKIKEDN